MVLNIVMFGFFAATSGVLRPEAARDAGPHLGPRRDRGAEPPGVREGVRAGPLPAAELKALPAPRAAIPWAGVASAASRSPLRRAGSKPRMPKRTVRP